MAKIGTLKTLKSPHREVCSCDRSKVYMTDTHLHRDQRGEETRGCGRTKRATAELPDKCSRKCHPLFLNEFDRG